MKVKIGDTTYDSDDEPIMVILTPMDRLRIASMPPDCSFYVSCPEGCDLKLIRQWIAEVPGFAVDGQAGSAG